MIKLLILILNYSALPVITIIFIWAVLAYWKKWSLWLPIWVMSGFLLLLAIVKIIVQYEVWNSGSMSRPLLHLPIQISGIGWFAGLPIFTKYEHGYFAFYSWNHFLAGAVFSIIAAFVLYFIFRILRRYKKEFFKDGEMELGLIMALLVGWPQIIIFAPLVLISAVIFSIINYFRQGKAACGLFWPFAVSALVCLVFSLQLASWRFSLIGL